MFKYNVRGENIEVTPAIRQYLEKKIEKLARYFKNTPEATAHVNLKVYSDGDAKVEVTMPLPYLTLRAEEKSGDLYGSIDLVVDKLERQIRKYKTKINRQIREKSQREKMREAEAAAEVEWDDWIIDGEEEAPQFDIVRTKKINLKPMDAEEAILQMNMLGHQFFIFDDVQTNGLSIVYKRKDGRYGLISVND